MAGQSLALITSYDCGRVMPCHCQIRFQITAVMLIPVFFLQKKKQKKQNNMTKNMDVGGQNSSRSMIVNVRCLAAAAKSEFKSK